MARSHYRVLTEKGLRWIIANSDYGEAILASKAELVRRGLPVGPLKHLHTKDMQYLPLERERDGYEKDN